MLTNIIPTYNRSALLKTHLDQLDIQTINGFEVIVVSDGSTDGTKELVESYSPNNYSLRFFEIQNKGFGAGLARNTGIRAATHDKIVFTDDDCLVNADYLEKFYNSITSGTCIVGSTNITATWSMQKDWYPVGANAGLMRQDAIRAGLFDEGNRFYGYEDSEFGYKLFKTGTKVLYNPDIFVFHVAFEPFNGIKIAQQLDSRKYYQALYGKDVPFLESYTEYIDV